jgi:chromosome segregation ATPase
LNFLNKMGLCKLYLGETAESLARLYEDGEKRLIQRDAEINRLCAEIERLNSVAQKTRADWESDTSVLSNDLLTQAKELKTLKAELEQHKHTVNQALKENSALSERVISQHKEIQDLKRRLETTEKDYQFTTNKLKDLRNAVAHIELCVKEAADI